jgi:hypothetical protein
MMNDLSIWKENLVTTAEEVIRTVDLVQNYDQNYLWI